MEIFGMHNSSGAGQFRFREKPIAALFSKNNILVRTTPRLLIKSPGFYKFAMRLMDLHSYPEVERFTGKLKILGVKDLLLKISNRAQDRILDNQKLFGILEDYIKDKSRIERMVMFLRSPGEWLMETFSPGEIQHDAVQPGERDLKVAQIADILARIKHPETHRPLLPPKSFDAIPDHEKDLLDGSILEALLMFKQTYMEEQQPDSSFGTIEYRRILTIDLAMMLTQLLDPGTNKAYLDPDVFTKMPCHQQIVMGFGRPNPIYEALQNFLRTHHPKREKEQNAYNILTAFNYALVKQRWENMLAINERFGPLNDN